MFGFFFFFFDRGEHMGFFTLYCTIYLVGLIERETSPCFFFFACFFLLLHDFLLVVYWCFITFSSIEVELKRLVA